MLHLSCDSIRDEITGMYTVVMDAAYRAVKDDATEGTVHLAIGSVVGGVVDPVQTNAWFTVNNVAGSQNG